MFDHPARVQPASNPATTAGGGALPAGISTALDVGVVSHGEHIADLVLAQAATSTELFKPFREIVVSWLRSYRKGEFPSSNEKIDGSPAIVIGFSARNIPFVAYKGGFTKKAQELFTSKRSILNRYPADNPLRPVFLRCYEVIIPRLKALAKQDPERWRGVILQGDLLFTEADSRRVVTKEAVSIRANEVGYVIGADSPLHSAAASARVGVVFHSLATRIVEEGEKRVTSRAGHDDEQLRRIVQDLSSAELFAVDPLREPILLRRSPEEFRELCDVVATKVVEVGRLLHEVCRDVGFQEAWRQEMLEKTRRFLNLGLKPGARGGLFKAVRVGEGLNVEKFIEGMRSWIVKRIGDETRLAQHSKDGSREFQLFAPRFEQFISQHRTNLERVLLAFYRANEVQRALHDYGLEGMRSKLGGGPIEGLMLRQGSILVKWVDRLDFTMANNLRNRARELPAPFDVWTPGAYFYPGKFQPFQAGHAAVVQHILTQAEGAPVYIIVSPLQPRLAAKTWSGMKVAETKADFRNLDFKHVFSRKLRMRMLRASLPKEARVYMASPEHLWKGYLSGARAEGRDGRVFVVVGEKEMAAGRYTSQLQEFGEWFDPVSVPMQAGGISGTELRRRVKAYAFEPSVQNRELLLSGLRHIRSQRSRISIAEQMAYEYRRVARCAEKVLEREKERAAAKRKAGKSARGATSS